MALDSVLGFSHELFHRFDWGCNDGEHVGWAVVEAQDPATAKMFLPVGLRPKTRVVGVVKFTAEDIKSFHDMSDEHAKGT